MMSLRLVKSPPKLDCASEKSVTSRCHRLLRRLGMRREAVEGTEAEVDEGRGWLARRKVDVCSSVSRDSCAVLPTSSSSSASASPEPLPWEP